MLQYIKKALQLFVCLAVVSCKSENDLVSIKDAPSLLDEDNPTEKPQLDVLLVLDNSCSMIEDWDFINYGLTQVPIELNYYEFNWKMGLISMDPSDAIFVEVPNLTSPSDAGWQMVGILDNFRRVAGQEEQAFSSALAARTRYSSWFRQGVYTLIVFISDEKEQSGITASNFRQLWGYPHIVTSIVGPDDASMVIMPCAEEARAFHEASDFVIDICTNQPWSIVEPLTH
jgi:hypothetical protein